MTTDAQRAKALGTARRRKRQRSRIKARLSATPYPQSLRLAAQLIATNPVELESLDLDLLLCACRAIDQKRARRILRAIPGKRTVGDLSGDERRELLASIDEWIANATPGRSQRAA